MQRAYHCRCCWSEVKVGADPYAGREDLRPEGWAETYKFKIPAVSPEADVEVEESATEARERERLIADLAERLGCP